MVTLFTPLVECAVVGFASNRNHTQGETMAKAYWVSCYHSISDPAARAEYAKLAGPA